MSSAIQGTLTVIGAVPIVGEFADGLAALICLGEGDTACAALSVASMVPVALSDPGSGRTRQQTLSTGCGPKVSWSE